MSMMQSATLVSGKVKIGMTRGEAVYLLGKPRSTETVGLTEFLNYTPVLYALPLASEQSPIAIRDGKVVSVGKAYYDAEVQGRDAIERPCLGYHMTIARIVEA